MSHERQSGSHLCISKGLCLKVLGSRVGSLNGYSDWGFSWFYSVIQGDRQEFPETGHDRLLNSTHSTTVINDLSKVTVHEVKNLNNEVVLNIPT
jgi:hypothetical protein